jgi:hypothetical protein
MEVARKTNIIFDTGLFRLLEIPMICISVSHLNNVYHYSIARKGQKTWTGNYTVIICKCGSRIAKEPVHISHSTILNKMTCLTPCDGPDAIVWCPRTVQYLKPLTGNCHTHRCHTPSTAHATSNYTHLAIFPDANFLDTVVHLKKFLYLLFTVVLCAIQAARQGGTSYCREKTCLTPGVKDADTP